MESFKCENSTLRVECGQLFKRVRVMIQELNSFSAWRGCAVLTRSYMRVLHRCYTRGRPRLALWCGFSIHTYIHTYNTLNYFYLFIKIKISKKVSNKEGGSFFGLT